MPEVEEKYIGLTLAVLSTLGIGASFTITKKGLNDAADKHGFEGDGFAYLKTPIWWVGITSLILGELANFAAYAFAPAIVVTPLGALSIIVRYAARICMSPCLPSFRLAWMASSA